jgi:ClpP class serine protease
MRSLIPGIRAAAYSALWAMKEEKLHAVLDFIDLRAQGITLSKEQRKERGIQAQAGRSAIRTVGQIAILPLKGVIAHHAGMEMDISGGTSTVAFGRAFSEAVNTPDVAAIVIDCDSPGGTIEGVPELAAQIRSR